MLVVSSKVGETIIIDSDIYITFLRNKESGVNVAIDAPGNVSVGTLKASQRKKWDGLKSVNVKDLCCVESNSQH